MAAAAAAVTATKPEDLPWYARLVDHVLTPGSSLTTGVWATFNAIIGALYVIWLSFFVSFPDNVHVWVFFFLLTGLAITTNYFMKEVFAAGMDFESTKKEDAAKKVAGGQAEGEAAPAAVEAAAPTEAAATGAKKRRAKKEE
jgi:hypothetical protein